MNGLADLHRTITGCRRCPRLVRWRESAAQNPPRRYVGQSYWAKPLPGFGEVEVEVTKVDGQVVSWCLLLAETPAQTSRGLMEVTDPDLGGYRGMLFRFDSSREGGFYMRNTPQPLMIAYLDEGGAPVTIVRMEPCGDVDGCPTYPPTAPYRWTVEVPVAAGGVAALGIEPGAVLTDTGRTCSG